MKKIFVIILFLHLGYTRAQVFPGSGGAILNTGQDTYFPIPVAGLAGSINGAFGLEQVCFTINHPNVSELYIYLQSPSGTWVNLTLGSSSSGADFINTCVNSQSGSSVTLANAPYSGAYRPVGYLGRFNTGQNPNGTWNLIVHDGFPGTNAGTLISYSIQFGNAPTTPVAFSSSNLPLVFINTSQPISEIKTVVNMGIVDNGPNRNYTTDAWNNYNNKAEIHWHGSSTRNFEKKAFSIDTKDAGGNKLIVPILGMPAESDWMLIASYIDKTLLRIPFTYDLYRAMGNYAARYRNVELVINNEYQGVYAFTEKLKRDSNRIHVQVLGPTENSYPAVSGGYIIKIDRTDAPGWYSLLPGSCQSGTHFYYNYVYPDDDEITFSQKTYLKSYIDSFETVMNAAYYADPFIGYQKYINLNSFVDFFIMNELSKNVDAYRLSTYLYKKNISKGGKLYIGPVWDYDIAWHNCNYGNSFSPAGWQYQIQDETYPAPTWWDKFMQDNNFKNALFCRWTELRQNILSVNYLHHYLDSCATVLNESQQRNFTQFPILGAYIFPNPQLQPGATYLSELNDLKSWIANRIAWLDGAITGPCIIGTAPENEFSGNLNVYPNPSETSTTFEFTLPERSDVSLSIIDLLGKEVSRYMNSELPRGESRITLDRNGLPAGIYLYQLQVNNLVKTGKLVMR